MFRCFNWGNGWWKTLREFLKAKVRSKEVLVPAGVFCALLVAAFLVGISDNVPGLVLCFLAAAVPFVAVTRKWQRMKSFLILLGASLAGFLVFVVLHNAFYAFGVITERIPVFSDLMGFFDAAFFIVAVFICPVGVVVGVVGSVTLFIRRRRSNELVQ